MTADHPAPDAELFQELRRTWETVDPVPADLVERMVAVIAAADLPREYALLTLVHDPERAAVRGEADMLTLQFGDGVSNVLVHVTPTASDARRLDGWIDGEATAVHLLTGGQEREMVVEHGRFAFDDVPPGLVRLRIVLVAAPTPGAPTELITPRFEL